MNAPAKLPKSLVKAFDAISTNLIFETADPDPKLRAGLRTAWRALELAAGRPVTTAEILERRYGITTVAPWERE